MNVESPIILGFTTLQRSSVLVTPDVLPIVLWGSPPSFYIFSVARNRVNSLLTESPEEVFSGFTTTSGEVDEEAIRSLAQDKGMLSLRDSGKERKKGLVIVQEVIDTTMEV